MKPIGNHIVFIVAVNDNAPVLFTLVSSGGGEWVFENKEHSNLKRVVYGMDENKNLYARTETKKGKKDEFFYKRVN
ncbi:MAG: hypothetical protein M3Q97_08190 [Bacteroidota bacterium]|nr:hypothetical protein [Bacteroidota bacterium]